MVRARALDTLANLTKSPICFDGLPPMPGTLYARALFFDDTTLLATQAEFRVPGAWVAGIDLSVGIQDDAPLLPLALGAGQGKGVTRKLWALRKLSVEVSRAAGVAPKGNGQGPLTILAVDKSQITATPNVFALGTSACADLSGTGKVTLEGILVGTGPYWLTAVLDDYGLGGNDLSGALAALELVGGSPKIPATNQLSYAADAYSVSASVQLSYAFDPPDGGADGVSCSTLDASAD